MRKQFISLMVFVAGVAVADWRPNVWPAWEHPRSNIWCALDIQDAIIERASTTFGTNKLDFYRSPTETPPPAYTNRFYRYQRDNLLNAKRCYSSKPGITIPVLLSKFVWLATNAAGDVTNVVHYTWEKACADAGIPTNYLDYTPFRYLSGLGHFTNDATVGHPYGWTNEYTQAGGSNFPGARTNWYTTDYGWDGMKNLCDLMRYTEGYEAISNITIWKVVDDDLSFESCPSATNAPHSLWASKSATTNIDAWADELNYKMSEMLLWFCETNKTLGGSGTLWGSGMSKYRTRAWVRIVPIWETQTWLSASAAIYLECEPPHISGTTPTLYGTYDDMEGTGLTNGFQKWHEWTESTNKLRGPTDWIGSADWSDFYSKTCPVDGNTPYGVTTNDYMGYDYRFGTSLNGMLIKETHVIYDWTGTNGFDKLE